MKKTAFQIAVALSLLFGGCSRLVTADRSKVPDDLYRPADFGDGGDAAATDGGEADGGIDSASEGGGGDSGADLDGTGNDATAPADGGDAGPQDATGDLPGTG